jgi:hypothetical protein
MPIPYSLHLLGFDSLQIKPRGYETDGKRNKGKGLPMSEKQDRFVKVLSGARNKLCLIKR